MRALYGLKEKIKMGKKKRLSNANLMHTFRKDIRAIEKELDDNITNILFCKYFDRFAKLSEDYLHHIVTLESSLYDTSDTVETIEKKADALEEILRIFESHTEYEKYRHKVRLIHNDLAILEKFKHCIFYDIVLESEVMFREVVERPAKRLDNITKTYKMATKDNAFDLERTKYVKIFSQKFTVVANLLIDETVNAACREVYATGDRIKDYLQNRKRDDYSEGLTCDIESTDNIIRRELNYIDLNSIATECDFIKVRQKGSHAQYKHSDGRLITIPQGRMVGKGLSIKIQKDLALS